MCEYFGVMTDKGLTRVKLKLPTWHPASDRRLHKCIFLSNQCNAEKWREWLCLNLLHFSSSSVIRVLSAFAHPSTVDRR